MGKKSFFLIVNKEYIITLDADNYAYAKYYAEKLRENNNLESVEVIQFIGNHYRRTAITDGL